MFDENPRYDIVFADDRLDLEIKVNDLLGEGFIPTGGPVVEDHPVRGERWYQAVYFPGVPEG